MQYPKQDPDTDSKPTEKQDTDPKKLIPNPQHRFMQMLPLGESGQVCV